MKVMKFYIALLLCLFPSLVFAGTAHYVDCNASQNGTGSYASPWNNIPSVNSHNFNAGDDVYFKVKSTCTLTSNSGRLQIDWGGTSGDRAIIGAYYGDGQFGLNGNPRPIINGDNNSYPGRYKGLVEVNGESYDYITIQDLKVQYSSGMGIEISNGDNINVDNCYTYRTKQNGIIYANVDTGIISNNRVENVGYPAYTGSGAAIEVTATEIEGSTTNITVEYNTVLSSKNEGIGFYKKVTYSTMQYNVVYDIRAAHLYVGSSKYNIIRYNLVYGLSGGGTWGRASGISVGQEERRTYSFGGNTEIYGNLVAGCSRGVSLGCILSECTGVGTPHAGCKGDFTSINCHDDTYVYNNTLVDNNYNFRNWQPKAADDIYFKNNISLTITGGMVHAKNYSPAGVTWGHNLFDDSVYGNAATDAVIGDPALSKTSGWRSLTADGPDGTEFSLLPGSDARDAGLAIYGYNSRISASDYTSHPIMLRTATEISPVIGAWMGIMPAPKPGPGIAPPKGFKTIAKK